MSYWEQYNGQPDRHEALDHVDRFYEAWADGDGKKFTDQLHRTNCYDEEQIRNSDRSWNLEIGRKSLKHVAANPQPERILYSFGDVEGFGQDDAENLAIRCKELHIITADMTTHPGEGGNPTGHTDVIKSIEQRKRHLVGLTFQNEWGVVI